MRWAEPPPGVTLAENAVHVWRTSLRLPAASIQQLRKILAPDEIQRADRFRFAQDRQHFTVARGVLRQLLGRYLQRDPAQIQLQYNAYGKPALAASERQPALKFNLSHSGELALYAFAYQREVGIDVEWRHRRVEQAEGIAARFFSAQECAALRTVPAQQQQEAFLNCWTRKEAYIKARGRGLSLPLHQFDVSLRPGEPARLLATRDDPNQAARWTMQALQPGAEYIAALVVEGDAWELICWHWTG
ncbi:4'-phosphopantetheinyl transferase superfamily protein [candidate division KSB3 bacterium]|uniref:4'-phosphopantetheinyl transferase superfamily protein n=1 Tax=candidate division KSB3 bacterium TaxID=2044937 RepID=A0A9D5JYC2_9BACT|nr:4'-phosphopantetheinyl transferase superfamily protein [candidate division KSB3 bacterium]MBD3326241.1 4'-phosphopantetheinyl transferase superfamily protein [candidate division KSB3 bacterium]